MGTKFALCVACSCALISATIFASPAVAAAPGPALIDPSFCEPIIAALHEAERTAAALCGNPIEGLPGTGTKEECLAAIENRNAWGRLALVCIEASHDFSLS